MIVVWRVTERCNLSCAFCAYDRRLPGTRHEVEPQIVRRFAEVLGAYQAVSGDPVLLSWIGGEPLLWRPVFDVSAYLHKTFGIRLSATTNGTTLHLPEVQRGILAYFNELTVSVDGFADFHEAMRRWPGGWQRLRAAVRQLADARDAADGSLKLRANIVVMHDNLPAFTELCEELADWGFNEITFNQLGGRDRPEFFPAHRLRAEDARALSALIPSLQGKLALRGIRLCANEQYLQRIEASSENRSLPVADCGPGQRFVFIDERNRIAPCHFTSEEFGIPLTEMKTAQDLLNLPTRFSAARRCTPQSACSDCPSTQVFAKFAS